MRTSTLSILWLTWAGLLLASARGETKIIIAAPPTEQDDKVLRGLIKAIQEQNSPEPTLRVELSYPSNIFECTAPGTQNADVESGYKGTTVQVPVYSLSRGTAQLVFKNAAPPMRFTMKLTGGQSADLSALSLTSGSLTLAIGPVGEAEVTRAFDAKGRAWHRGKGAAYTVRAKRTGSAIEVEL